MATRARLRPTRRRWMGRRRNRRGTGGNMRHRGLLRQGFFRAAPQHALHGEPLGAGLGEAERVRPLASDHDQVDAGREELRPLAEALAADALDPVARDGVSNLPRHHDADTRRRPRGARRGSLRRWSAVLCRLDAVPKGMRSLLPRKQRIRRERTCRDQQHVVPRRHTAPTASRCLDAKKLGPFPEPAIATEAQPWAG